MRHRRQRRSTDHHRGQPFALADEQSRRKRLRTDEPGDIGRVVAAIAVGEHAHVHNIKTKRW